MPRIAYVNGRYVALDRASIAIEDRGFQFADGVYEVIALRGGALLDLNPHLARLGRSLDALSMAWPMARAALCRVLIETVRRNGHRDGLVYLQITRGRARREHAFPVPPVHPSLVVTVRPVSWEANARRAAQGIAVVTRPDLRWKRRDIKSVALLPNVLARQQAKEAGAGEAWLVDEAGFITEGAASSAWIIDRDGRLITRALGPVILAGITRETLLSHLADEGIPFEERGFSVEEALAAQEAFITGAGTLLMPVIALDGHPIGTGRAGPIAMRLRDLYVSAAQRTPVFSHVRENLI